MMISHPMTRVYFSHTRSTIVSFDPITALIGNHPEIKTALEEYDGLIRLIDKRYQFNRATLLISNHLTKEEFASRVDARIMDRMNTAGGVCVVSWPSIRGRV